MTAYAPAPLAELLLGARRDGTRLTAVPEALVPPDAAAADQVQFAVAEALGGISAWKVFQVGAGEGMFSPIVSARVFTAPYATDGGARPARIEMEVAFRIGRDLPPRPGQTWTVAEVEAAVAAALPVFEFIDSRYDFTPPALLSRADMLNNWGLVTGPERSDWRAAVHDGLAVRLEISGRAAVDQRGGHPSGDPAHPLTWLANHLNSLGLGLKAGDIVTTGAFAGGHPIAAGDSAVARIEGFAPITCQL